MNKVAIVSDSTCVLPSELIKKYNIGIAPCHLILDGRDYLDDVDITIADYLRLAPNIKNQSTSGGGVGSYYDAYARAAKTTDSIVSIPLSRALSASYNSAVSARDMILSEQPNLKIEIVDGKTSVGALGLIALEAARAAEAGKSLAEVKSVAEDMVLKAKYSCVLESLRFFIKIGRAPAGAEEDEKAGVKGILAMNSKGLVEFIGKERGLEAALDKMVDLVPKYCDISKPLHVVVSTTDKSQAKRVIDQRRIHDEITGRK